MSDDTNPDTLQPLKVPSRPGSRWATGKRTKQQGYKQPAGFARGCRVTQRTVSTNSEKPVK